MNDSQPPSLMRPLAFLRRRLAFRRLARATRFQHVRTRLVAPYLTVTDGPTFLTAYRAIMEREIYRFNASSEAPYILDCGANVGLATIYVKRRYPKARVVAFEADPQIARVLRDNIERCVGLEGVEIIPAAVLDRDADRVAFRSEGADAGRIPMLADEPATDTVRSVRLKRFLDREVDLLKLDIEGAELPVLLDCAAELRRVRHLFVEYHGFVGQPQQLAELLIVLRDAGLRVDVYNERPLRHPLQGAETFHGMDFQAAVFGYRPTP